MELKAKVVECINHVERNAFLAQLDNDTKRRIAGFAGRFARLLFNPCNSTLTTAKCAGTACTP
jgi:hypothetical protein